MVATRYIPIKRKYRRIILAVLVSITIVLLLVLNNIGGINDSVVEYIPQIPISNPMSYFSDYYNEVEEEEVIDMTYPFNYKTFNEKHPSQSPYNTVIREMFSYLNDLDISEMISYEKANEMIEYDLLDHKFSPLSFQHDAEEGEQDTFVMASEERPYDMNPRFYWELLLLQYQQSVTTNNINKKNNNNNKKITDVNAVGEELNFVEFTWYDFVNNVEYNNYLRNIHYASNHGEMWDLVDCSFLNNEIFDVSIFKKMRNPVFFYNNELYSKSNFLKEHDKKMNKDDLKDYCLVLEDEKAMFGDSSFKNFAPKILQTKINFEVRPEVYHLQSMNRIFNSLDKPLSIGIINIQDNSFKQLFINKTNTVIAENYVTNGVFDKFKYKMNQDPQEIVSMFGNVEFEALTPIYTKNGSLYQIDDEDFVFDLEAKIKQLQHLESSEGKTLTPNQKHYLQSLLNNYHSHYSSQPKYFVEANDVINTYGKGFHHDHRFYTSQISSNVATLKITILQGMLKTLTATLQSLGLVGWISHGNMYGWMYNGLPFIYDDDIDFQLPLKHMHLLAETFNQSILLQDPRFGNGRYFLDFGNLGGRGHGNGKNNIDGRLIDVDTGLYIDITGLSFNNEVIDSKFYNQLRQFLGENDMRSLINEKDPSLSPFERMKPSEYAKIVEEEERLDFKIKQDLLLNLNKTLEEEIKALKSMDKKNKNPEDGTILDSNIDAYIHKLTADERFSVNKKIGLVTCKNRHFVNVNDYKTLIHTFYQQTPIILPSNYMDLLHKEYKIPKEFAFLEFEDYVFQPNLKTWMKKNYMTDAMHKTHLKPWNFATETTIESMISSLAINNTKDISSTLTLEETEILLFNMCDFENEITIDLERFSKVVELSNWATQFHQSEYRFKEMSILNGDIGANKSVIAPSYLNSSATLFNDIAKKMVYFEMHGEEKLYKDAFEFLKILQRLHDKEIYGYDMTQICRKHIFKTIQALEDSKFNEVSFLGVYNFVGKPVWEIPGVNVTETMVDELIDHNIYLR